MNTRKVFLSNTDTTAGFLCNSHKELARVKNRSIENKTLQVVKNNKILLLNTRVPNKFKNKVRRAKISTFIYSNKKSFRVLNEFTNHNLFINKVKIMYSSSANETKKDFSLKYAYDKSDIIIFEKEEFTQKKSSSIFKISNKKILKLR